MNKTFRLFVSSTFSDFREERRVLQTKVFPEIKRYCKGKGYTFQPVDLRWGINHEAQLDQKTLEICLNEVRSCKTYPHPNFLVMLGDRYGWIPLPYMIEKPEFEQITDHCSGQEKKDLHQWYQLDYNQIPPSYILKERTGKFTDDELWQKIEKKLLGILQMALKQAGIGEVQQKKYFTSATEAEIIEGIINYDVPTDFQKKMLQNKPVLKKIDANYVFGFIRNISQDSGQSGIFQDDYYQKAQDVKYKLKSLLPGNNIFEVETRLKNNNEIELAYLEDFAQKATAFLKQKINEQIAKDEEFTDLEKELYAQEIFAVQKRKHFTGQQEIIDKIQDYINNDSREALIISGKSGSGKSSVMAQSIYLTRINTSKKTLFRFIGATAGTANTKSLLLSVFQELGFQIETNTGDSQKLNKQNETLEEFSERIQSYFYEIKEQVVLFIDAVDQLNNRDFFLWLPPELPPNLKIVISALQDDHYKDDSEYFETLSKITSNTIELKAFRDARRLLLTLLKEENRSLQAFQLEYFEKQYQPVQTPLFVYIAAQEIKNWKSFDKVEKLENFPGVGRVQRLAGSQKGIIKEYIDNLSEIYHHDAEFVSRILGYIYASQNGLSEAEILTLISQDKKLVDKLAPGTFHKNLTNELPIVIWIRLYNHLKAFLSTKNQDNENLLFFFHREFAGVIAKKFPLKDIFKRILSAVQKQIVKHQNEDFYAYRWGRLYLLILTNLDRHNLSIENEDIYFLKDIKVNYVRQLVRYSLKKWDSLSNINASYVKVAKIITEFLIKYNRKEWEGEYSYCLNDYAFTLTYDNEIDKAIRYERKALQIREKLKNENPGEWTEPYIVTSINLADSLTKKNLIAEAIDVDENVYELLKKLYLKDNDEWEIHYTTLLVNLAYLYNYSGDFAKSIKFGEEALEIRKTKYNDNPDKWGAYYAHSLNNLADIFEDIDIEKSIKWAEEALRIREKLYDENPLKYVEDYTITLNNLSEYYKRVGELEKALLLGKKALRIRRKLYLNDKNRWGIYYATSLNNIAETLIKLDKISEALVLDKQALAIRKQFYENDKELGFEFYTESLNNIAFTYKILQQPDKAYHLQIEAYKLIKTAYKKNKNRWLNDYLHALINISDTLESLHNTQDALLYLHEAHDILIHRINKKLDILKWGNFYITTMFALGNIYYQMNRMQKANTTYKELDDFFSGLDEDVLQDWILEFANNAYNLAMTYTVLNKYEMAEEKYLKAAMIYEYLFEFDNDSRKDGYLLVLENLLTLYQDTGNKEKAEKIAAKIKELNDI